MHELNLWDSGQLKQGQLCPASGTVTGALPQVVRAGGVGAEFPGFLMFGWGH